MVSCECWQALNEGLSDDDDEEFSAALRRGR